MCVIINNLKEAPKMVENTESGTFSNSFNTAIEELTGTN